MGFGFGSTILNLSPQERNYELLPPSKQRVVQLPCLASRDILVCTTRPPMSEFIQDDRKKVEPANTTLEHLMFSHFWPYFDRCARSSIKLSQAAAAFLPDDKKNRGDMGFQQKGCCSSSLGALGAKRVRPGHLRKRTAAFLLSVDELWPGGPGLKAAWGVNAIVTLVWCFLLRDRYSALLANKGLTVVEIEPQKIPDLPNTYDWARDWNVTPLLETGLELLPTPSTPALSAPPAIDGTRIATPL